MPGVRLDVEIKLPNIKNPIIGRFQTDQNQSDFLQLENKDGGNLFAGIDYLGHRYGALADGDFSGVSLKTISYQVLTTDNGKLISLDSASGTTVTLLATAPDQPWFIQVQNVGSGTVTIDPNGLEIDGSTNPISLSQNEGIFIGSDGTNYYSQRGIGGIGGTGFAGVNAQTDDYTALSGDNGKLITFTKTTAVTLTLPVASPGNTWFIYIQNRGAGFLTINRNGLTIDGAATNIGLLQNQGLIVFSDGTNYFTDRGVSGVGNVNVQTDSYTLIPSDAGKLISLSKVTALTATLPATSPGPAWFVMLQNTGAGILTVSRNGRTIDGAAADLTLTTNQGTIIYSDGTNYFTERGSGSTASNVAIKPGVALGIQFVTAEGNDANDGLSLGSAKLTIMAGYDALPAAGGTVFIVGQGVSGALWPRATSTNGQGIWIMGTTDPNYASPPAGWRKCKNGSNCQVAFIGIPSSVAALNAFSGNMTSFLGGDSTNPAIWLSNVSGVTFRNLYTQYPKSFLWVGVNSNGNKNDNCGGSDLIFDNCGGNCNGGDPTLGPVVDIGPNLFWVRFTNCAFNANSFADEDDNDRCSILIDSSTPPVASITATALTSNVATVTAANDFTAGNGATVIIAGSTSTGGLFNGAWTLLSATATQFTFALTHANVTSAPDTGTATPNENFASAIIYFENLQFTGGGGIRNTNNHRGTAQHVVKNCAMEGAAATQPIYEAMGEAGSAGTFRAVINLSEGISDSGEEPPWVKVAVGLPPWSTIVSGGGGGNGVCFQGPMTYSGVEGLTSITGPICTLNDVHYPIVAPQAYNQKGSIFAKDLNQSDAARRVFIGSPRFTNLAVQLPASWVTVAAGSITTGQTAPDGTTNAGLVSGADSTLDGAKCFEGSRSYNAGDYLYFGVWMRSTRPQTDSIVSASPGLYFVFGAPGFEVKHLAGSYGTGLLSGSLLCPAVVQSDGEWQWVWGVIKVTTGVAVSYTVRAFLPASTGHNIQYYAPIFCHITSAQVQTVATTTIDSAGNSGATQSGNIVTIKTTANHNLITGQPIIIRGVTAGGYNGEFVVASTPSATTFTYYNTTTGLSTSGSGNAVPGNDSEVCDWAMNNVSYGDDLIAGALLATPRGVRLAFGGSGDNFHGILDHTALTANRTITVPDASGTIILTGSVNTFAAQQNFGGNIKVGAGGTVLSQFAVFTAALAPASVAANTSAEEEFTVTGVAITDKIFVNGPAPLAGTGIVNVRASNTDKVSITFMNTTAGGLVPTAGDYTFFAIRS